jgi:hypothetical protein
MKRMLLVLAVLPLLFVRCEKEDDTETKENILVTVSAKESTIYNGVETSFSASVNGEIKEAVFYFDGQNIGSSISHPYNIQYTPTDIEPGNHKITCIVKSKTGNDFTGEVSVFLKLRLGDEYQGGKIFFLETSGEHGLISSTVDLSYDGDFGTEVRFSWGSETLLGTTKDNGKQNTALMAANAVSSGYAGFHFKNGYNYNSFSDWYIPSIDELELLKENKSYVGGFSNATDWQAMYWSSSESNSTMAFILNFNALMGNTNDKIKVFKIRPIRKF